MRQRWYRSQGKGKGGCRYHVFAGGRCRPHDDCVCVLVLGSMFHDGGGHTWMSLSLLSCLRAVDHGH